MSRGFESHALRYCPVSFGPKAATTKGASLSDLRPRTSKAARRTSIARHGRLKTSHPFLTLLKLVTAALAVVLVSGVSVGAIAVAQLGNNIETVELAGENDDPVVPPTLGSFEGGFNILIVGSDVCERE